jgi:hypothetical protein
VAVFLASVRSADVINVTGSWIIEAQRSLNNNTDRFEISFSR